MARAGHEACTTAPRWGVCATVQVMHQQSRHSRVALMHHVETVRPAGPECAWARANSAAQSESTQNQGQREKMTLTTPSPGHM